MVYHGHPATLIESQSSTYAMLLSGTIQLADCPYTFINVEDRSWMINFILWTYFSYIIKKWNSLTNCYSVFLVLICLKTAKMRLSYFEVFNSNFNILNV